MNGTWCVYLREWITWRYAVKQGDAGRGELKQWLDSRDEIKVNGVPAVRLGQTSGRWCVELLVPVLKGEWKDRPDAEAQQGTFGQVVESGSGEEAVLVAEGRRLKDLLR